MENNFNKHIREIMNNPPEYAPDDKLWAKMKTRLDDDGKEEKRRVGGFLIWLPWLLALTMTAFAGLTYFNAHSGNYQNQNQKRNQKTTYLQVDTILSKKTVIIYDTIYNSTIVSRNVRNSDHENANYSHSPNSSNLNRLLFNSNGNAFSGLFSSAPSSWTPTLVSRNRPLHFGYISAILDAQSSPDIQKENNIHFSENQLGGNVTSNNSINNQKEIGLKTNISFLPSLPFTNLAYENVVNIPLAKHQLDRGKRNKKSKENINYLLKIKPTSFSLAGFFGKAHSLNLTNDWGKLQGGGRAEIGYGRRFSLVIGFEKIDNSFDILYENNEQQINNKFPVLPPNNSGDVLHEMYGDFKYWQVPFGIKYSMLPRGVLHPYMGVGLVSKKAIISNLRYEYFSLTKEYYVTQQNLLPDDFAITDFWTTLGFQFDLNRHWGLIAEGSSQFRLRKTTYQYENTQLIKWNAGLQYNF